MVSFIHTLVIFLLPFESFAISSNIQIEWRYTKVPIKIRIHEVEQTLPLFKMDSVKGLQGTGVGPEIAGSVLQLEPNRRRMFALVAKNDTAKAVHFFAAPHQAHPAVNSFGFKFKCLCVNHVYRVGPGETWYRVVELRLASQFKGSSLTITHDIIGVGEAEYKDAQTKGALDSAAANRGADD